MLGGWQLMVLRLVHAKSKKISSLTKALDIHNQQCYISGTTTTKNHPVNHINTQQKTSLKSLKPLEREELRRQAQLNFYL